MADVDVLPLPPRYRFRDLLRGEIAGVEDDRRGKHNLFGRWFSEEDEQHDRVRVEFFTNERSLKQRLQLYFIKNQRSSLRIRIFNLFIKLLSCVLYLVRASLDDIPTHRKALKDIPGLINNAAIPFFINSSRIASGRSNTSMFQSPGVILAQDSASETDSSVDWAVIIWVTRDVWLWAVQVTVAIISLTETLLLTYLGYKGNILQQILSPGFILEIVNTVPFIVTVFYEPLRDLFIPVFLNCWLAKAALESMLNDLHRAMQKSQSALAQQLIILTATITCLVFTSVCGIQHLQRGGKKSFSLFDSLWFVIVTLSTVGYGDLSPDIWPSKTFMMILIGAAFSVLPTQFEQLAFTWMERQKQGGTYSSHRAQNEKHVVVVATVLHADSILDFLNEFYAHPKLQDYFVVLLSPMELDPTMKMILQVPIWAARVIYIRGSALKDTDLSRCRVQDAEACFMIANRNYTDRAATDQHTILRAWAVKDFAPHCPQYVQIFRPENKIHVHFAEHLVCEDEFKYALLCNNTVVPGCSTFITLLLHTSRGAEGQMSGEEWSRLYGKCSGNEIYSIELGSSRFFGEYENKSFTYASFHAHRKYGVALVGIRQKKRGSTIQLNPGPRHIMKATDLCFYMSITKEENSAFVLAHPNDDPGRQSVKSKNTEMASMAASVDKTPKANVSGSSKPSTSKLQKMQSYDEETGLCSPLMKAKPDKDAGEDSVSAHSECSDRDEPDAPDNDAKESSVHVDLQHPPVARQASRNSQYSDGNSLAAGGSSANKLELPPGMSAQSLMQKRPSIAPVPAVMEANGLLHVPYGDSDSEPESDQSSDLFEAWSATEPDYVRGFPPVTPYIGTSPTLCHLLREKRSECCLQLAQRCSHCDFRHAKEYNWPNRAIIVAADYASNGLYNFIVPLRSHARPKHTLKPIVLLLERPPEQNFLETICYFPMVYWMIGSIENLDDMLRSGINLADNVVIVNKESSNAGEEETLSDCNTIVAVQTIFRLFPGANIITELSQASNMRFMQFRAKDHYALQLSKMEKKEKERGSHLYYMFRLPFAAGNVFSASMLDTLLYQAFVKDYLITFVRLLLGIDQAVGSGHLHCMTIRKEDLWIRTFGRLYQKLCSTTCEIPIGIYRTQMRESMDTANATRNFKRSFRRHARKRLGSDTHEYLSVTMSLNEEDGTCNGNLAVERQEISQMVKCRMSSLGLTLDDYGKDALRRYSTHPRTDDNSDKRNTISYVIINPSYDLKLENNDIIYLIRPSSLSPQPSPLIDERKQQSKNMMKREEPTGAEKAKTDGAMGDSTSRNPPVTIMVTAPSQEDITLDAVTEGGEP